MRVIIVGNSAHGGAECMWTRSPVSSDKHLGFPVRRYLLRRTLQVGCFRKDLGNEVIDKKAPQGVPLLTSRRMKGGVGDYRTTRSASQPEVSGWSSGPTTQRSDPGPPETRSTVP